MKVGDRYIGFIRTFSLHLVFDISVSLKETEIQTKHMAVGGTERDSCRGARGKGTDTEVAIVRETTQK